VDEIVWLYSEPDPDKFYGFWLGALVKDGEGEDCESHMWGNTYGSIYHASGKWHGDVDTDQDYKPTYWCRLPEPPELPGPPNTTD
jgi:hypothetical protein